MKKETQRTKIDSTYAKLVAPYADEALKVLSEYVAIPSVYDEQTRTTEKPMFSRT